MATSTVSSRLTWWVLGFALAGALTAYLFGDPAWAASPDKPLFYELVLTIKSLFIQALRMFIAPVIFFSLLSGVLSLGDAARLRKMGAVVVSYYLATTSIAILLGLAAVTLVHPWESMGQIDLNSITRIDEDQLIKSPRLIDPASSSVLDVVTGMLKSALTNPFSALSDTNILGIVANALLFGIAILLVAPRDGPLVRGLEEVNQVIQRLLSWVILTTPIGVFAIIFDFSLTAGGALFGQLLSFTALVLAVTAIHGFIVLPAIAWFIGGLSPADMFRGMLRPFLVAFSTSSSSATLPVSMKACEEDLKIPRGIVSFVLPLGATMNMDGTALFEGIAAVFLAYLFGVELSSVAIVTVFIMAMVASIGAPGMPSGSMAGMQMVMLAVGIPLEAIALLLVVERPLDTLRTAVNVEGDMVGAVVARRFLGAAAHEDEDAAAPSATHHQ